MHGVVQVVEHDDGLLGEGGELDIFTTDLFARSQLDTASSSMNGNTAIMMEAALSSAVMHPNIVQTYNYETRPSSNSGGQVMPLLASPELYTAFLFLRAAECWHVPPSDVLYGALATLCTCSLLLPESGCPQTAVCDCCIAAVD